MTGKAVITVARRDTLPASAQREDRPEALHEVVEDQG